jgi:RNA-binding protein Luc7-like 2
MQQRNNRPPQNYPAPPPVNAPSGPSAPFQPMFPPRTPNHGLVPPADELPAVGHGDKVKREAGELVEDVKDARDREHDRYDRREDRYSDDRRRDRYEEEPRRRHE